MQFIFSVLALWTWLHLALQAGVSALPIPNASPIAIVVKTVDTRATSAATRPETVRSNVHAHRRQSRVVRRAAGSRAHRPLRRVVRDESKLSGEADARSLKRAKSSINPVNDDGEKPTSTTTTNSTFPDTPPSHNGSCADLFPVTPHLKSWTTCSDAPNALKLSDAVFGAPVAQDKSLEHPYESAPDGKHAMKATYPKGSYALRFPDKKGGLSFYAPGNEAVDLTTAKEATFGYSVFFPEDFDFALAGKLPGLYGGDTDKEAVGCSGGSRSDNCFSARLMWREQGKGEFYTYLPPSFPENKAACKAVPHSGCDTAWGASIGTGSYKWTKGAWTTVSQRIRLNDVGESNGELELWVNGESVIQVKNAVLRSKAQGRIRGLMVQSFFGGSSTDAYASPKTQNVFYNDFSVAVTKLL